MKTQNIDISKENSVLRDDFRSDSDVDVLVEFHPDYIPGFLKLHRIQEELSTLLEIGKLILSFPNF